jgi:D-alanine-D-alanine ligase
MKPVYHITLMAGGTSAEREVSLRSGAGVAKALRSLGHEVTELDPAGGEWVLPAGTDVVCLAPLHGTYGEDGTIQRELESKGVPYTGCDANSSAVAFDKLETKKRCLAAGVPTPRFEILTSPEAGWPGGWHPPVVLKPVCQGSSIGLQFVERREDWRGALSESFRHDSRVLMEERIAGRELTVGILENRALPVLEVRPRQGGFDYRNKYTPGATEYLCPALLPPEVAARAQEAALGAFRAVGGRDFGRVDVMLRDEEPFVLEVNTLPGMTETSLFPKAAAAAGVGYAALCERMIELALQRRPDMPKG